MFLESHDRHSEMQAAGQELKLIRQELVKAFLNGIGFPQCLLLHCNSESYT